MNDYNRLVNQYNAIVEQNKQLQAELATAKINYQELHDECAADYADYTKLKDLILDFDAFADCICEQCPIDGGDKCNEDCPVWKLRMEAD